MSTELDSGGLSEPAAADTAPTTEIAAIKETAETEETAEKAPSAESAASAETVVIAQAVVIEETAAVEETAAIAQTPAVTETAPAEPARRRASHRAHRKARRSARLKYVLAGVVVIVALAAGLTVTSVKTVLKQSFTRLPQPYAALYFTSDPTLDGAALTVPISVQPTDEGVRSYNVRVWTVTAAGTVDPDGTTATVAPKNGVWATVVTLKIAPAAAVVWVALDGTQQTLHYRIDGA